MFGIQSGLRFLFCLAVLALAVRHPSPAQAIKDGEVLIHRDRWGVPHIYGNSIRAVAFGSGYAQAEDHLERLLRLFLKARGELSKVEGQSALNQDFIQRMLLLAEIVDANWDRVPQAGKDFYQAFADGINRFIDTHPKQKLPWYWKVQARDAAIYGGFTILRNGWGVAMRESGAGGDTQEGSNAWAIAGLRSLSGGAMLLADPHLPWQSDVQWYESHLKCPEFDVAGASFIGSPLPILGHNAEIAWTATNNNADTADLYLEKTDPENPDRYLDSDGQWKPMERRSFKIEVRQPDGSLKTVERAMRYTRRGPYMPGPKGRHYSVAIAGWKDLPDPLTGAIQRAAARDLKSFRASLTEYPIDKGHSVYADRRGNIYTVGNGLFPRRDPKYNWRQRVPGWEPGTQWNGIIPFAELPQFSNPPSGLIVQCNNSVYSSAQPPPLDPAKYPPYVAPRQLDNPPDTRAGRVYELLDGKPKISWEDHRNAALDLRALTAGPLMKLLLSCLEAQSEPVAGDLKEIYSILKNWDYMATLENRAVPILSHWLRLAGQKKLDERTADRAQALAVLKEAAAEMRKLYGSVGVPMRQVQVVKRGTKEYPCPGVGNVNATNPFTSLFMTGTGEYENGKWYAKGGSSWLMLLAFDSPMRVFSIMPVGQSEDPASPHFADLTELFSKRELKPLPFTDEEVRKLSEKSYRLKL
jgi:acyl-homoserine-lactone acylase